MPNFFMPLLGGLILDKIGIRIGLIIFSIVLTFGSTIFALGAYQHNFAWLLAGRVINGMGSGSLSVA